MPNVEETNIFKDASDIGESILSNLKQEAQEYAARLSGEDYESDQVDSSFESKPIASIDQNQAVDTAEKDEYASPDSLIETPIPPKYKSYEELAGLKGLKEFSEQTEKAIKKQAKAQVKQGDLQADYIEKIQREKDIVNEQIQKLENSDAAIREKNREAEIEIREKLKALLDQGPPEFSDKSIWGNEQTPTKIIGLIGMALSNLSPGGSNNIASMINLAINEDVRKQKNAYNRYKGQLNNLTSAYSLAKEISKSDEEAHLLAVNHLQNKAQKKIESIASSTNSQAARFKAQELANATISKSLKQRIQLQKLVNERINEADLMAYTDQGQRWTEQNMKSVPLAKRGFIIEGYSGVAPSEKTRDEIATEGGDVGDALSLITDLVVGATDAATFKRLLSPDKKAELEAKAAALVGVMRQPTEGPGALTREKSKIIKELLVGDPNKLFGFVSSNRQRLISTAKFLVERHKLKARRVGNMFKIPAEFDVQIRKLEALKDRSSVKDFFGVPERETNRKR